MHRDVQYLSQQQSTEENKENSEQIKTTPSCKKCRPCNISLPIYFLKCPRGRMDVQVLSTRYKREITWLLTLPMLRLRSFKAQGGKDLWKSSKPCHVGIQWIALAEFSQMSTHLPGFQSFFRVFASFCIGQSSQEQHKGLVKAQVLTQSCWKFLMSSVVWTYGTFENNIGINHKLEYYKYLKEICK